MADSYNFEVEGKKYEFIPENFEIKEETQLAYSQAYGFYLKNGTMTKAQAIEVGRKNGVMDEEWDKELQMCIMNIATGTASLKEERDKKRKNKKKIDQIKKDLASARRAYEKLTMRQSDLLQATCENLAENRAIEYSVVARLMDEDGNKVFKDHEDLVSKYNETLTNVAVQHMTYLKHGLPYNLEGLYPEEQDEEKVSNK